MYCFIYKYNYIYIKIIGLDLWKMFEHLNLVIFCRIKAKLDREGVVQDFINALEQLSSPEMLFKVALTASRM